MEFSPFPYQYSKQNYLLKAILMEEIPFLKITDNYLEQIIEIYNKLGQIVKKINITRSGNLSIDITKLSSDVYFLKAVFEDETAAKIVPFEIVNK